MRITDAIRVPLQQVIKPGTIANSSRTVSDVSREERQQLLTEQMRARTSGSAPTTYSERAQLLSTGGAARYSWVA